jgi:imidazolonepropionase-like amidohydrolase
MPQLSLRIAYVPTVSSIALVALTLSCTPAETEPPDPVTTAFTGARLVDGTGGAPVSDAVLLVEDGRFVDVGPSTDVVVPEDAIRVDLSGRTVIPALVDAHKHIAGMREELLEQLEHFAYYGVGTVVSLGTDEGDLAFEIRSEAPVGRARLLTAGRGITSPEPGRSETPYWVTSAEEGREAVAELAAREVDLVKIWVDDRNGAYEKLPPEIYGAIIEEAHARGLRVTAHIFAMEDAEGLLEAGVDAFAHGVRDQDVDEEFLALIEARPEVFLVPNLPDRGVASDLGWLAGTIPADELAQLQAAAVDRPDAGATFGIQARNLERMNAAGVRIAFGTDGGTPWAAHVEMEDMVASGMAPGEVIVAATATSAELLGLDDAGTVEAGKSADFIVLDADPLADITNTRRISDVYLGGSRIDRDALGARLRGEL